MRKSNIILYYIDTAYNSFKECPQCFYILGTNVGVCTKCNYIFNYPLSAKKPSLDSYDNIRDEDGQYSGKYGIWYN
tara:strand:+ start:183 stop:410 length:228 start_codon:yes stop_codon:yes gene_type:complete